MAFLVLSAVMTAACGDSVFNGDASDGGTSDAGSDASALDGAADASTTADAATRVRRVLVTSRTFDGQLAGSDAGSVFVQADSYCSQAAFHLGDAGTFAAWVGDSTRNASERGVFNPPYVDATGGVVVFDSSGNFNPEALVDEFGVVPPPQWWTGMSSQSGLGDTCSDWHSTNASASGSTGSKSAWFGNGEYSCDLLAAIICFEQ